MTPDPASILFLSHNKINIITELIRSTSGENYSMPLGKNITQSALESRKEAGSKYQTNRL